MSVYEKSSFDKYHSEILPDLMKKFKLQTVMQAPKIEKISITITVGNVDKKLIQQAADDLSLIAGQKSVVTIAKKSISSFKLREGMPVGSMVTLRKKKMYEFMDRFINISLPRIRDFRGLNVKSIDDNFNYNIGIKDYTIFPEVAFNPSISKQFGLSVSLSIKSSSKEQSIELLKAFNFPIV